jgi:hypothetical protein
MKLFHVLLPLLTAILATKTDAQTTNAIPRAATVAQLIAPTSLHAQYMAAHMLTCAADKTDPAAMATRSWAFVLLRLPFHAIESLKSAHDSLSRAELTFLGGEAGRLQTEQQDELTDMLAGYLPLVESSNSLCSYHLANLQSVARGGPVLTNQFAASVSDPKVRKLASGTRPILVALRLSRQWIDAACARGAYMNLAEELRLVAELRRHPLWDVVVIVSAANTEAPLMAEIWMADSAGDSVATIQAKPALLGGLHRDESQAAIEEFVIAVLTGATSAK